MNEHDAHQELLKRAELSRRCVVWEPTDDLETADGIVTAVCAGGALLILVLVILGVIV